MWSKKKQQQEKRPDEILDVLSCTVVPDISAHINFSFGSPTLIEGEGDDRKYASLMFPSPIRVDIYNDEGSNLAFEQDTGFEAVSETIPGVLVSSTSLYLRQYLKNENWVDTHSGKRLSHYVIWSFGGGVIHVLSVNVPFLEEI